MESQERRSENKNKKTGDRRSPSSKKTLPLLVIVLVSSVLRLGKEEGTEASALDGFSKALLDKLYEGSKGRSRDFVRLSDNVVGSASITTVDALMRNLSIRVRLRDGEGSSVGVSKRQAHQEVVLLASDELLTLLLRDVSVEPRLVTDHLNLINNRISRAFLEERTEPVAEVAQTLHRNHLNLIVRQALSQQSMHTLVSSSLRISRRELQLLPQMNSEGGERKTMEIVLLLTNTEATPELTSGSIGEGDLQSDFLKSLQNGLEQGTLLRVLVPAFLKKLRQSRMSSIRDRRALLILADGILELFPRSVVIEGILTSQDLPANESESINISLLVERLTLKNLRRHEDGLYIEKGSNELVARERRLQKMQVTYGSSRVTLILNIVSTIEDGRKTEIAELHVPMLVDEDVGRLQIAMENRRLRAVEPVHTESEILHHLQFLQQRDMNLGVMEQVVQRASREELSDDGKVTRLGTGTHEENDVGVAQMTNKEC